MATTSAARDASLSMKLLVDNKARRVLFAEAGKDVVDFLFSLLALPVGTAVDLLGKGSMVGSVGNLYASVAALDDTYVLPGADKGSLLHPVVPSPAASSDISLLRLPAPRKGFFKCRKGTHYFVTDASDTRCPTCGHRMMIPCRYVPPPPGRYGGSGQASGLARNAATRGAVKGFVQGIVTYTVMDDLTVTPMSAISSITLLNAFAVDLSALQEKTVRLGYTEGLAILKASLRSKTVLTDVFLAKKAAPSRKRPVYY